MRLNLNDIQFTYKNIYDLYDMYLFSGKIGNHTESKESPFIQNYFDYLDAVGEYIKKNYSTYTDGDDMFEYSGIKSYQGIIHVEFLEKTDREFIEIKVMKLTDL
ncbi:hypothetical protein ACMG5I_02595 [Escherichia coli]|uniref:hypothetical protein n=1 Tax=Escherichia coli TaxID=562 RepID=UPI002377924E|nr:hypothetical protein vBEcoMphAPEC6_00810 [Escherichia phage ph0011]